ncbi:MAG: GNAT family N-acetyltransferase [Bacteroidota bacterium]|nr:GNAT family N-acetyltransferase [Bacteroidota bacterium]
MNNRSVNMKVFEGAFPLLESPRLILREFNEEDARTILAMRIDGRIGRFIARPEMEKIEDALGLVRRTRDAFHQKMGIGWAGIHRKSGKLIGSCGFNQLDILNLRAEIGGEMEVESWGTGLAQEAVRAILEFGFSSLGLNSIEAKVDPGNRSAIALLHYFGFEKEAHFKDRILFDGQFRDMAVYTAFKGSKP